MLSLIFSCASFKRLTLSTVNLQANIVTKCSYQWLKRVAMLANLGVKYVMTSCEVCKVVTVMFKLHITDTLLAMSETIIDYYR